MHSVISDNLDTIKEICRYYDVGRLEVYGSAARATDFNGDSEVEFLATYKPGKEPWSILLDMQFQFDLEAVLGHKVSLCPPEVVPDHYLRYVNDCRKLILEDDTPVRNLHVGDEEKIMAGKIMEDKECHWRRPHPEFLKI